MNITDSVTLGDARVTDTGYLEANARTARVGIQQYLGSELGRPDLGVVNVYRDEAEVFAKSSLETFSKIPVTNDHPSEKVTADNWKRYAVGTTGDEVLREGEYLKIGLKITDAAAVKAIRDGKRELSVGYETALVWEDGVAPDGTPYQARQTQIVADHIAIVARGRAGSEVRIGDGAATWGISPIQDAGPDIAEAKSQLRAAIALHEKHMSGAAPTTGKAGERSQQAMMDMMVRALEALTGESSTGGMGKMDAAPIEKRRTQGGQDMALKTIIVDGLPVETTDAGEAAINKLRGLLDTASASIAAKDTDLAKKDAEIDDLKGKQLTDADLDKRVAARAALVTTATAIAKDVKTDGLSDNEIRAAVVRAKIGDAAVKDKSADYVNARFDILAEDVAGAGGADPFRDAMSDRRPPTAPGNPGAVDAAYKAMTDGMTSAWQTQQ
ncbi:DUF2213 domain-containing protein [Caulobacter sp. RHG1]|uniref:DUF2213 domain-containing protein n=1 Tax=Caulobacter sp. (strain RHG1) TaxID=2545762 RepID=UPI00155488C6|nr:DUF2213 domain-containing protein [Caulobacter sp. RHG1]NQE62946.1 Phage protein [Caulobacter sp. RHG1]